MRTVVLHQLRDEGSIESAGFRIARVQISCAELLHPRNVETQLLRFIGSCHGIQLLWIASKDDSCENLFICCT